MVKDILKMLYVFYIYIFVFSVGASLISPGSLLQLWAVTNKHFPPQFSLGSCYSNKAAANGSPLRNLAIQKYTHTLCT